MLPSRVRSPYNVFELHASARCGMYGWIEPPRGFQARPVVWCDLTYFWSSSKNVLKSLAKFTCCSSLPLYSMITYLQILNRLKDEYEQESRFSLASKNEEHLYIFSYLVGVHFAARNDIPQEWSRSGLDAHPLKTSRSLGNHCQVIELRDMLQVRNVEDASSNNAHNNMSHGNQPFQKWSSTVLLRRSLRPSIFSIATDVGFSSSCNFPASGFLLLPCRRNPNKQKQHLTRWFKTWCEKKEAQPPRWRA